MTSQTTQSDPIILEMRSITKEFPGVKALSEVNLRVKAGEIHAICGENGAGKSTLMKVLSGVYPYGSYDGDIVYQNEVQQFKDIRASEHAGIVIIHQELALIPELSIMENIFLGNEPTKRGVIDWAEARTRSTRAAGPGGTARGPGHPHQGNRRRQAAARGNRQGAEQVREAADPGRAHRRAERIRFPAPAGPDARAEGPRHHVHHHFPQAQRDRADRRLHHHHPRRQVHRDPRREGRRR